MNDSRNLIRVGKTGPALLWNSPTATTWASFASRFGYGLVVLPLVLINLGPAETGVWLLFRSVQALQGLAALGFTPTFVRVLAFAMGGASDLTKMSESSASGRPSWTTVAAICRTMRAIYFRVSLGALVVLTFGVTWAFIRPIGAMADPALAWLAWAIVVGVSTVVLGGSTYSAFLQGMNKIPDLRRWEALTNLGGIFFSVFVLLAGWELIGLVIAEQSWRLIGVLRNAYLCKSVCSGNYFKIKGRRIESDVLTAVWPSAWRSGLGVLMGVGVIEASGLLYAQIGAPAAVTSYLIALRLMRIMSGVSQAPFYSKIPLLARFWAEGRRHRLIDVAKRGMRLSYWAFVIPFVLGGLFGGPALDWLGSKTPFPEETLWITLGVAFFLERYGAMHLQLYSTTNHIVWHVAAGISGVIFMFGSFLLLPLIDIYAFPVALIVAYAGFLIWYCASHSYRAFALRFWNFELATSIGPTLAMVIYALGVIIL